MFVDEAEDVLPLAPGIRCADDGLVSGALSKCWTILNWATVRLSVRNRQRSGIMGSWAKDQRPDQAGP
jgi:hypothetical protein